MTKLRSLPPKKPKNKERRSREYLTEEEIERLLKASKISGKAERTRHRNYTLILMMYRHGLRVGEATDLRWNQIDLNSNLVHLRRLKNGKPSIHPLDKRETLALKRLKSYYPAAGHVFTTSLHFCMTTRNVHHILQVLGKEAELDISIHPHMLRHSCGYYLANKSVDLRVIQDYLGHKDISHTVVYTALAPKRFENLWEG